MHKISTSRIEIFGQTTMEYLLSNEYKFIEWLAKYFYERLKLINSKIRQDFKLSYCEGSLRILKAIFFVHFRFCRSCTWMCHRLHIRNAWYYPFLRDRDAGSRSSRFHLTHQWDHSNCHRNDERNPCNDQRHWIVLISFNYLLPFIFVWSWFISDVVKTEIYDDFKKSVVVLYNIFFYPCRDVWFVLSFVLVCCWSWRFQ